MKLTDYFLALLEQEAGTTRKTLERVPSGRNDWKPHEKSMPLGYLSVLVATLLGWTDFIVNQDELDIRPPGKEAYREKDRDGAAELIVALDEAVAKARAALTSTTDEHLMKPWRFVVGGQVVSELPRWIFLRDSVFSHLSHHRGQLSVYLRLTEAKVPAMFGPSADEPF